MRHRKHTFKVGRTTGQRRALIANLLAGLFKSPNGRIKTTLTKAKELRRHADKMITAGKAGDLHNRRKAIATIGDVEAVSILFDEIAPKFADRPGGYTRIVKLAHARRGDGADLCFIELVGEETVAAPVATEEVVEEVVETEEASEETDSKED